MAISPYLAMTAEEIAQNEIFPEKPALLYCPFSEEIPAAADCGFLVLTDSTPVDLRYAESIIHQLNRQNPNAVVVDFQRSVNADAAAWIRILLERASCPVYVSDLYAAEFHCPVFLSPVPLHRRLTDHIALWKGLDICLDIAAQAEHIRVTQDGSNITPLPCFPTPMKGHYDRNLHCHYSIQVTENEAVFTLWRTREDLEDLMKEAENCGVVATIGLYQELGTLL